MKSILITGGTGLIGSNLSEFLSQSNYKISIVSRKKAKFPRHIIRYQWDIENQILDFNILKDKDIIIHLAGEPITSKRWTKRQKSKILNSRVSTTRLLYQQIKKLKVKPKVIIAASAIGIYPYDTIHRLDENETSQSNGLLQNIVKTWEQELTKFSNHGIRIVILRIGIVLSKKGGILSKLLLPFKLGLGFPMGTGEQLISWIHILDLNRMIKHCIEDSNIKGIYNATAPYPVTNNLFSNTLSVLLKRNFFPSFIRIPSFLIKLFLGQMSDVILKGHNISSNKIKKTNFQFKYENIHAAILNLLESKH